LNLPSKNYISQAVTICLKPKKGLAGIQDLCATIQGDMATKTHWYQIKIGSYRYKSDLAFCMDFLRKKAEQNTGLFSFTLAI